MSDGMMKSKKGLIWRLLGMVEGVNLRIGRKARVNDLQVMMFRHWQKARCAKESRLPDNNDCVMRVSERQTMMVM